MAHFAQLDENNIVINVVVISNDDCNGGIFPYSEESGISFCKSIFGEDKNFLQTSYNSNFRNKFAGVGMIYSIEYDAFLYEKPFNSWILNDNLEWSAPIPYPEESINGYYTWNEEIENWEFNEINDEI